VTAMPNLRHVPQAPVMSAEDDEMPAVVRIMVRGEVSKRDKELFAYLMQVERAELDDQCCIVDPKAPAVSAFVLMWYETLGIVGVEIDPGGRMWISKTRALEELLREPSKKNGRRGR